ncbi:unnamed protein product [Adineta ricciae]|uniref:Uncharacterized protein n=1 Tax=Adineta ricciae TaxID=249248 RepID=A0A815EVK2_ADIRI|nr:unnamed protein product [Adineta ricciae]CAF1316742.1 unnamed protein product [Adineta ricciae]
MTSTSYSTMEMESFTEKRSILSLQSNGPFISDIFQRQPAIERTRRKIITYLFIEFVVMISYVILQIVAFILDDSGSHKVDTSIIIELIVTGVLVVYNLSFIIMLTEYFPRAISVFSCLTLVQLASAFLLFVLSIMTTVVSLSLIHAVRFGIILDVIYIVIALFIIGLSASIYLCLLNLAKLMEN